MSGEGSKWLSSILQENGCVNYNLV